MKEKIISLLKKIKDSFFNVKFLKYAAVGTVNTVNTAIFSTLFAHIVTIQENVSGALGFIASMTVGYFLHTKFVFEMPPSARRYVRFMISYIPNFVIYNVITALTISVFGWSTFVGTSLASIIGVPVTYLTILLFAFSRKIEDEDKKERTREKRKRLLMKK